MVKGYVNILSVLSLCCALLLSNSVVAEEVTPPDVSDPIGKNIAKLQVYTREAQGQLDAQGKGHSSGTNLFRENGKFISVTKRECKNTARRTSNGAYKECVNSALQKRMHELWENYLSSSNTSRLPEP